MYGVPLTMIERYHASSVCSIARPLSVGTAPDAGLDGATGQPQSDASGLLSDSTLRRAYGASRSAHGRRGRDLSRTLVDHAGKRNLGGATRPRHQRRERAARCNPPASADPLATAPSLAVADDAASGSPCD